MVSGRGLILGGRYCQLSPPSTGTTPKDSESCTAMDLPTPSQRYRGRPRKAGSPADAERGVTSETIKPPYV